MNSHLKMEIIKKYKKWNPFERRWFWSNLILTALGTYSFFVFDIIFRNVAALIFFEALLIYYNNVIYRSLTRQEMEWKGLVIDPITSMEVSTECQ